MRINVSNEYGTKNRVGFKQQHFLTAEAILKYLLGTSERIVTMITCKNPETDLTTTDYEVYQALGSVTNYDAVTKAKLVKLFEAVDVHSYKKERHAQKKVLTHARVEELRKLAFNKISEDDKNE